MEQRAGPAVAVLVVAVFLAVDPAGWYPFGPVKVAVVSVGVLAAAALALAPARSARPALVAAGVLVGVMAVAATFGRDPLYAWTGTPERRAGVALWAVCAVALAVGASVDRRWVERGVTLAGVGLGLVGLAEALGWEPAPLAVGSRLTGTFGSSAYLGAAVALVLPVAAGVAADPGSGRAWRRTAGAAAALLVVPLVGSGARSAWLGLVVAGLVVGAARPAPARARAVWSGAVVVVAAAALVLTPAGARLASLADGDAPGGSARLDEWRVAARVVADQPVLGVGPEGYRIAFAEGVDERYEVAHGRDPLPDRAHSGPLDVALAGGLLGLAAWLAVWGLVAARAWPLLRRGEPARAGVAAALVAHLAGQLTLFPLAEVEPVAWLLAGTVVATAGEAGRARAGRAVAAARAACAIAATAALVVGARDVLADRAADRSADALAAADGPEARARAEQAVALRPDVVRLHLLLARARVAAGEGTVAALAAVEDAAALSPDDPVVQRERLRLLVARAEATEVPAHAAAARRAVDAALAEDSVAADLWLLAGAAARLDGDPDAAVAALQRAERLAPTDVRPPLDLALAHLEAGDRRAARAAVARAEALAPDDPRVAAVEDLVGGG